MAHHAGRTGGRDVAARRAAPEIHGPVQVVFVFKRLPGAGPFSGFQKATMLSLVSSGVGISTRQNARGPSCRPAPPRRSAAGGSRPRGPGSGRSRDRAAAARTARVFRAELGGAQHLGVGERAPEPLPGSVGDEQAVRIVHLRPVVVVHIPRVLPVPEHARERGQSEDGDRLAEVEGRVDAHHRRLARRNDHPIRAGDAPAVEQREMVICRAAGAGRSIQNSRKIGNSSPVGWAVSIARPRADRP